MLKSARRCGGKHIASQKCQKLRVLELRCREVHAHVGRSTQVKSVRISELMVWNHFLEVEKEKEIEIKVEIKMEIERNREILCKQTD